MTQPIPRDGPPEKEKPDLTVQGNRGFSTNTNQGENSPPPPACQGSAAVTPGVTAFPRPRRSWLPNALIAARRAHLEFDEYIGRVAEALEEPDLELNEQEKQVLRTAFRVSRILGKRRWSICSQDKLAKLAKMQKSHVSPCLAGLREKNVLLFRCVRRRTMKAPSMYEVEIVEPELWKAGLPTESATWHEEMPALFRLNSQEQALFDLGSYATSTLPSYAPRNSTRATAAASSYAGRNSQQELSLDTNAAQAAQLLAAELADLKNSDQKKDLSAEERERAALRAEILRRMSHKEQAVSKFREDVDDVVKTLPATQIREGLNAFDKRGSAGLGKPGGYLMACIRNAGQPGQPGQPGRAPAADERKRLAQQQLERARDFCPDTVETPEGKALLARLLAGQPTAPHPP